MKHSLRVVVLAVLALLLVGPVPKSLARPTTGLRLPVGRTATIPKAVDTNDGMSAAGYGTGTIIHADALRTGEHALADVDVAFSGAAFSQVLPAADYVNEVHRTVSELLKDKKVSYGRGTGLELGIASDPVPVIGPLSKAEAPDSTDLIHKVVGPIAVPGVVRAELLRSQAQARTGALTGGCPLSGDGGYGLGSVLNLELLGGLIATHAAPPYREVSQSNSSTRIVPSNGRLGLRSETRQTIAPVTLFGNTPLQTTIEVLGEWALSAAADGIEGTIHYGPRDVSPETPVVRILNAKGEPIIQVTTQMLLGKKGLEVTVPGVAELVIGEDPRMIGDNASSDPLMTKTQVAAAADVVRVKGLDGKLADVRIGHMEAAVTVPADGVHCPGLLVDQTPSKPTVTINEDFSYIVKVTNPNDCIVTGLKLVEAPTAPAGVKIEIVGTDPPGGTVADGVATYPDLGPLGPGETKTVKINATIPPGSAEGLLKALVVATGVCPADVKPPNDTDGPATPGTPDTPGTPVRGEDSVDGPRVDVCVVPDTVGKSLADATKLITGAGCVAVPKDGGPGPDKDKGNVIKQGTPPGSDVPLGTPVEITIGGPGCNVPTVVGQTIKEATKTLADNGCQLGDTTTGTDSGGGTPGTIQSQNPPGGGILPAGTRVDVALVPGGGTVLAAASTSCTVPGLIGMTEADARTKVEAAGCVLVAEPKNTSKADEVGKVLSQEPGVNVVVPRGSTVKVQLGVQVLGATETNPQGATAPGLARTGGVFLAGLSLWLLLGGALARLAGSNRLWRLARRRA